MLYLCHGVGKSNPEQSPFSPLHPGDRLFYCIRHFWLLLFFKFWIQFVLNINTSGTPLCFPVLLCSILLSLYQTLGPRYTFVGWPSPAPA